MKVLYVNLEMKLNFLLFVGQFCGVLHFAKEIISSSYKIIYKIERLELFN